jgi:hypothetical protein
MGEETLLLLLLLQQQLLLLLLLQQQLLLLLLPGDGAATATCLDECDQRVIMCSLHVVVVCQCALHPV